MALTDVAIRKAKPADKPSRMFDGGGLYLEIAPSGGKLWRLKYRYGGKEKRLAIGTYPEISLLDARNRREIARKLLANGIDPADAKKRRRPHVLIERRTALKWWRGNGSLSSRQHGRTATETESSGGWSVTYSLGSVGVRRCPISS